MSNPTLAELRDINVEKQRESRRMPQSNMTSHIDSHTESNTAGKSSDKSASKPSSKPVSKTDGQESRQFAGNQLTDQTVRPSASPSASQVTTPSAGLSIRERLLAEAQQATPPKIVMKTVTIKMDPALDDRVEAHCHALGKKKQDVIQDALLLYFETLGNLG